MVAPLWNELLQHVRRAQGSYHVPGHKQGSVWDRVSYVHFSALLPFDLTEVGQLDDLHNPTGVIAEAQALAACAFAAAHTFFLVGGSTSGNLATLLSLCQPGDGVLVQRNSHQSVYHGCWLAQATPYPLSVSLDPSTGCELPLSVDQVEAALRTYTNIKVVVVTSPSYDGMVEPIESLAKLCRLHRVLLVVDEAHGAHFGFHPDLPTWAIQCGADVVVQSTHKMLPSLTMSSMLHLAPSMLDRVPVFQRSLRWVVSSSPSYLLLASLDVARRYMEEHGQAVLTASLRELGVFRSRLAVSSRFGEFEFPGLRDPYKILLRQEGRDGFSLLRVLQERGCYAEKATSQYVLLISSLAFSSTESAVLWNVLESLPIKDDTGGTVEGGFFVHPGGNTPVVPLALAWSELRQRSMAWRSLAASVGCVAADFVVPYPPGIPVLLPGERITPVVVQQMFDWLAYGGQVRGIRNGGRGSSVSIQVVV